MWANGRRRPDLRLWHSARQALAALVTERDTLRAENDALKHQFDRLLHELKDVTEEFRKLRMAVLARQKAGDELAALYRERDLERAMCMQRDPSQPLQ
jgi:regulator of replication initiation timing